MQRLAPYVLAVYVDGGLIEYAYDEMPLSYWIRVYGENVHIEKHWNNGRVTTVR